MSTGGAGVRVVPEAPVGPAPKVSVLITTYNHERYLAQALESALAQQTSFPFEIVVGEDCSTDGTRAVLERFYADHPDVIRMVLPGENLGPNHMYVQVMRAARGEYFAILDGDDFWVSVDKLQRQAQFLDDNDDYQVCFHDVSVVPEDSESPVRPGMPVLGRDTFELDDILFANFVPTASVMHRRVDTFPAWFTEFAWIDWLMLVLCAQRGPLRYLHDLESVYRVHDKGLWSSKDRESQVAEEIRVYEHLEGILAPRHRDALWSGLRRCHVQLAVEQAALAYDRSVAVVSEPRWFPWYFNGRQVRQLPVTEDATSADLVAQLERLRRLDDHPASSSHWRNNAPPAAPPSPSVYCVVESPERWTERLSGLQSYLERFSELKNGQCCAIYELPAWEVRERRVVAVELHHPVPPQLRGRYIDSPKPGTATTAGTLEVIGWALGYKEDPVVEITVTNGEGALARTTPCVERPDLVAAFPDVAGAAVAGFESSVDLAEQPPDAALGVIATMRGGQSVNLGRIRMTEWP